MKRVLWTALAIPFAAWAQSGTVTWTNPTTNTDGSAIPASGTGALTSTRVEYGTCSGTNVFGTKIGEQVAAMPATSTTFTNLAAGSTYCFRAFSKNSYGNESGASAVVSKSIPGPTPNPPVLSATITVAYELNYTGAGTKLGRKVATLGIGTPCMDNAVSTSSGVYYQISKDLVTLTAVPKSQIIVTQCEWKS